MRIVDLTVPLVETNNLVYPGQPLLKLHSVVDYTKYMLLSCNAEIWLHAGTHVDAPYHVLEDGSSIDKADLSRLVHEGVVLDLSRSVTSDSSVGSKELSVAERDLRSAGEEIKEGDVILLRTDWSMTRRPWTDEYRAHSPFLTLESADWLLSKEPTAVGFDFPEERVDSLLTPKEAGGDSHPLPVHRMLLGAGVYLVEHLYNLNLLKEKRFLFVAAPLKITKAEASPVRAFALYT